MRRRRNADASDNTPVNPDPLDSESSNRSSENNAANETPTSDTPVPDTVAEAAPRRRRTPARRKADATEDGEAASTVPALPPAEAEKPKRPTRRRTPAKAAAEEPTAEADTLPLVTNESATEVPATETSISEGSSAEAGVADALPVSGPTTDTVEVLAAPELLAEAAPQDNETTFDSSTDVETDQTATPLVTASDETQTATDATVVTALATDEAEDETPSDTETNEVEETDGSAVEPANGSSRRRNRNRRRRGRKDAANESVTTQASDAQPDGMLAEPGIVAADQIAPAPTPNAPTPTATATSSTVTGANGPAVSPTPASSTAGANGDRTRTRGLRRQPTGEVPKSDDGENTAAPTPADDLARRRVRGIRRQVVGRILGKPSTADVAAVPGEAAPSPAVAAPPSATTPATPPRYQPLPAETLARLPETRIVKVAGIPELVINGTPQLPLWFFVNTVTSESPDAREIAGREIRMAYDAGIRFFTLLAHLPWRGKTGERRYDSLDDALSLVSENAPDAFILPRLIFSPPVSWERAHPDEMTRYSDGETGDVSFASREFWEEEAEGAVRAAVERAAQGPHAGRVFGFYLEHGEWFYEKGRSYDYSKANEGGFRDWLKFHYKNSTVSLRAAWNDGEVTFDKAAVPAFPPPSGPTQLFSSREQRYADYHEYASDIVAQVITDLAHAIKEASGKRSAVAVSYGYSLELAQPASGHLALAQVLASPDIDILTGPISYSGRTPGGSAPFPVPIDSIQLAGKLWVSEDDTKTHRAARGGETPDTYNLAVTSLEATASVYARNFGAALTRGAGVSWMDLWGQGWLDDREIWQRVGYLQSIAETVSELRREGATPLPDPDVAVLVDERAFFRVRDESLLASLISNQRDALLRSGARVGFYLLSDLLRPDFPQSKLLLFLNAFELPANIRIVLRERFQKDGRTLAWLYGPGAAEENPFEVADAVGITLKLQPWGSKTGTQVLSGTRSPLSEQVRGQKLGEERRINPSFYVSDAKAEALGEYVGTGYPSLAVRRHGDWQAMFFGETSLPLPLLRGLYRLAGVPVYTVDDDVAWIGDHIICLHSAPGGGTTVYLPEPGALVDLLSGDPLASSGHGARLSVPPRGTRLLFYGTPEQVARFDIDLRDVPPGLSANEVPTFAPPALPAGRVLSPDVPAEDADLMAAAFEDDALFRDKDTGDDTDDTDEEEEQTEGTDAALASQAASAQNDRKKRRRRRRGRGARPEDGETETTDADLGEADESDVFLAEEITIDEMTAEDLTSIGTTAPGSSTDAAPVVTGRERRPSLEELLPLSEAPSEGDLPPIPDEFLPMDTAALEGAEPTGEESGRGRRRTRAPRRSRRLTEVDTLAAQEGLTNDPIVALFSEPDASSVNAAEMPVLSKESDEANAPNTNTVFTDAEPVTDTEPTADTSSAPTPGAELSSIDGDAFVESGSSEDAGIVADDESFDANVPTNAEQSSRSDTPATDPVLPDVNAILEASSTQSIVEAESVESDGTVPQGY